jgi:hypothetical protein
MKLLFIGSNPKGYKTLQLEQEMTDLQRRLLAVDRLGTVEFKVLPKLEIEQLPSIIIDQQPDVLHISAHAVDNQLLFSNKEGREVLVGAPQLKGLLGAVPVRPTILYLNACTTADFASELKAVASFTIGTTAEITNPGAACAASVFYEWLARGSTVAKAYQAASATLECIDRSQVKMLLDHTEMHDPETEMLVDPMRILAAFEQVEDAFEEGKDLNALRIRPDSDGQHALTLGLAGCPRDMTQLVIFTDDETYITRGGKHLEDDLCLVSRDTTVRGIAWTDYTWRAYGDFRLFATAATGPGAAVSVSDALCDALERYYFFEKWRGKLNLKLEKTIGNAIGYLRANDGTRPTGTMTLGEWTRKNRRAGTA